MIDIGKLTVSRVDEPVLRIIPTRYPQINLFDRASSPEGWDLLYDVESLTNQRLRDQIGDIRLVAPEDRVDGDGASWIMAAFTHPPAVGRGGRFNKDFGMYYCTADQKVAIAESTYHQTRFLNDARIETITVEMRVIRAHLGPNHLHDLRPFEGSEIFNRSDYRTAQKLGGELKSAKSWGIQYPSVRAHGTCFGVMRPKALSHARHWRYLSYHFEKGEIIKIGKYE